MLFRVLQFVLGAGLAGGGGFLVWTQRETAANIFPPGPAGLPYLLLLGILGVSAGIVFLISAVHPRPNTKRAAAEKAAREDSALESAEAYYSERSRAADRDWRDAAISPPPAATPPQPAPPPKPVTVAPPAAPPAAPVPVQPAMAAPPPAPATVPPPPKPVMTPPPAAPTPSPAPAAVQPPSAPPAAAAPQPPVAPPPKPTITPPPAPPVTAPVAAPAAVPPPAAPPVRPVAPPAAPPVNPFPSPITLAPIPRAPAAGPPAAPPPAPAPQPASSGPHPAIRSALAAGKLAEAEGLLNAARETATGADLAHLTALAGDHAAASGQQSHAKWLWRLALRRLTEAGAADSPDGKRIAAALAPQR